VLVFRRHGIDVRQCGNRFIRPSQPDQRGRQADRHVATLRAELGGFLQAGERGLEVAEAQADDPGIGERGSLVRKREGICP
jgi:hypothetical protein